MTGGLGSASAEGSITDAPPHPTRADIARAVCAALERVKPDGQPKLVSCHVAPQRMEAQGLIRLPLPTQEAVRPRPPRRTPAGEPQKPISGSRGDLKALRLALVSTPSEAQLWNELISRYHYDLTGARWCLPSAEAVLKLRALRSNGDCERYWRFHLKQQYRRVHLRRYAPGVLTAA